MATRRLTITPGCHGCSRRDVLHGLGAAAVGALAVAAGCSQNGSSLPTAETSSCSGGECIDLTAAANQRLTAAGGAMLIDTTSDTIMVVRISDTQVAAVSAICTHAGCSMDYVTTTRQLDCPCHASQFSLDGRVLRGPANRPLRVYGATLAGNVITIR